MFDEGLWSADDHLRILIAPLRFTDSGPEAIKLAARAGHPLHVDPVTNLRPTREFLHRRRQSRVSEADHHCGPLSFAVK